MPTSPSSVTQPNTPALPTFMDHIHELRGRLFWIALTFLAASAAAYPFRDIVISFLVAPLGDMQLYYLTPVGGFSFIIKVCTYVGIVATLPAIVFHLYRYLQPAVGSVKGTTVLGYVFFSTLLALAGIGFAYLISLPAALHFLTSFDLKSVTAMLTVDSYFSFVTTYLIGAALLFQLPLILLIINSIVTLPPKKLMSYQRHMLLGAFVVAAIISPTPDVTNQALLAGPIIIMYQVGILLVWLRNLSRKPKNKSKHSLHREAAQTGLGVMQRQREPLIPQSTLDELTVALGASMAKQTPLQAPNKTVKPVAVPVQKARLQPKQASFAGAAKLSAHPPVVQKNMPHTTVVRRSRPPHRQVPAIHNYRTVASASSPTLVQTNRHSMKSASQSVDGFTLSAGGAA